MRMPMTPTSIENYRLALNRLDRAAYLACFTADAAVLDPYGPRVLTGVAGLNKFFDGMERTWTVFQMSFGETFASADRVALSWQVEAAAKNGKAARFTGINVFTLAEDGLISRLEGYWDFKAMAAQLQ